MAPSCRQSLAARSPVMGVPVGIDRERIVSVTFSDEMRFSSGDWARLMDNASRRDPSNTGSPVEFTKPPRRRVSLSVSLTVLPEYQKAPDTIGMSNNPASKSLVLTDTFRARIM